MVQASFRRDGVLFLGRAFGVPVSEARSGFLAYLGLLRGRRKGKQSDKGTKTLPSWAPSPIAEQARQMAGKGTRATWRLMGSYKWGYKSPNLGYNSSCPTYGDLNPKPPKP